MEIEISLAVWPQQLYQIFKNKFVFLFARKRLKQLKTILFRQNTEFCMEFH